MGLIIRGRIYSIMAPWESRVDIGTWDVVKVARDAALVAPFACDEICARRAVALGISGCVSPTLRVPRWKVEHPPNFWVCEVNIAQQEINKSAVPSSVFFDFSYSLCSLHTLLQDILYHSSYQLVTSKSLPLWQTDQHS